VKINFKSTLKNVKIYLLNDFEHKIVIKQLLKHGDMKKGSLLYPPILQGTNSWEKMLKTAKHENQKKLFKSRIIQINKKNEKTLKEFKSKKLINSYNILYDDFMVKTLKRNYILLQCECETDNGIVVKMPKIKFVFC
jgi:hypothetical protein